MGIAQQTILRPVQGEVRSHDVTIMLGYAAFAIALLVAIYFDSMSSGIAPDELASITVFP
jgi:hypothetical protein